MTTYQEANVIVEQYNRKFVEWEHTVREKQAPVKKTRRRPSEKSLKNRLMQLQEQGKQKSQPRQNTNHFGIDS